MDKITECIIKNSCLKEEKFMIYDNELNVNNISDFNLFLENAIKTLYDTVVLSDGSYVNKEKVNDVYQYDKQMIKKVEKTNKSDCDDYSHK